MEKLREMEVARQEMKRKAFEAYFKNTEIYNRECHLRKADILETWSKHLGCYSNIIAHESFLMWQAAQEQMLQVIHKDQLNFTGEALSLAKLVPSDECTHAVINGSHYEFVDFQVFDDAESCLLKHVGFTEKGINSIIINNFAVIRELQGHRIEKLKLKLGIDEVNYDSKQ